HTRFSRDWSSDVCSSDLALAAQHFDALIISIYSLTAVVNSADRAVGERQHHDRGVHVARLTDARIDPHGGARVDFLDLAAHQEADHVEVVDHHVHEDAARHFDVLDGRRRGIAADDVDQMHVAQLTALDRLAHAGVGRVEAPVEAHEELHARLLHRRQHPVYDRQIE